ncbi:PREDICTED: F-box/FBD/LRR-repeat [Prunus dulcis]|uniref:PREDICTED: F-box/FBD/LRR-repeat n=2 Tax=Prunus dulcis TaxID=3755 RepID=A0A5E4EJC1_PRUDU|nr:F-box/FBD/LRR-repeat protein At1g13570-like isoform X1 [Prunus dulcis]XP_034229796.1 F-box/FBD/LRR-repeat protein At1g13570-like isoform X1 [Prunus dulcis]VVA15516.1 PREDICTED: F-box/FBD/LRR-repeat [Prunus dulcis]
MEQREPPKSRLKSEMESDRISNLPSDVIEQILSHLPMREAVRTSVLSSNWRYKWAMLRHLVFDDRCVSTQKHITFVDIVDHVLLGHIGPIHKFRLSHRGRPANWDIDFWILHLSRNSIKELILEIWGEYHYRIPSYLFSCQNMIHLELLRCVLKPPPTFKGFRNLKSLVISHVILGQDVFQSLIACCPLLERLTLIEFDFAHLKIDAPNLQFLVVEGDFWDLIFENTLNLIDVCVSMDTDVGQIWGCDSSSNLVKFMVHLPHIQRLQIQGFFLKSLAVGALSAKLPKPCLYLKFLSIRVDFNDPVEILTVLCLLRSSPAVQELEISVNPAFEELELSGDQERQAALSEVNSLYGNWICPFSQLRFVKISNVSNVKAQLDFIRFLLLNSPVLEKIIVKPAYADDSWEQVKQLLRLGRASVHSEIIFLDPSFELWQLR